MSNVVYLKTWGTSRGETSPPDRSLPAPKATTTSEPAPPRAPGRKVWHGNNVHIILAALELESIEPVTLEGITSRGLYRLTLRVRRARPSDTAFVQKVLDECTLLFGGGREGLLVGAQVLDGAVPMRVKATHQVLERPPYDLEHHQVPAGFCRIAHFEADAYSDFFELPDDLPMPPGIMHRREEVTEVEVPATPVPDPEPLTLWATLASHRELLPIGLTCVALILFIVWTLVSI